MARETAPNVRERILDAAVALLRESGVKRFAQPQVARAAGVPQGHLTYYFPRKVDLLAAVAQRFMELVARDLSDFVQGASWLGGEASVRARAMALAKHLVKDRERTRMLLGLVVEAEHDPALREMLYRNTIMVRELLARLLGREPDDPDVSIALAMLWGLGLQQLVFAEHRTDAEAEELMERTSEWFAAAPPPVARREAAETTRVTRRGRGRR